MGILFPLVIPTVCQLESVNGAECRVNIIIHAAAAIMGSAIYGNGKTDECVIDYYSGSIENERVALHNVLTMRRKLF